MTQPIPMVEIWRGDLLESQHLGHAVVCDSSGQVVEAWGDDEKVIYPRSSCKMLQALPLVESGAADAFGLTSEQLALSCASHKGAAIHTDRVQVWLNDLGLSVSDFRCGPQKPSDKDAHEALVRAGKQPCQIHNNCSGKHSGFLTLTKHLGAGSEYTQVDHPVQRAARSAFEEMTGEDAEFYGIDGCSAPNFSTSVTGLARAMARMAKPTVKGARAQASERLVNAMRTHPELVAGEGGACTELMRAMNGKVAIKTGAEAVYVAILPEQGLGMALKIADGGTRAAEAAIAGLLVKYGALDANHPMARKRLHGPILNRNGLNTGHMRLSPDFIQL
ncbi:asparaginase [Litoreibacter janthinus]|uniref:Asparaginase n=1 Tax=Litoreibacter janthinus TaxID=670154 RepID=A0A1I6G0Y0_9RHOB|nr:asparaginase [Litoreibacter janthinus]SFR35836.1 asparaginase [Litoreibacter janthinus]